jgi:hypothetical protein
LSLNDWDPSPGTFTIFITAYDEYGNVLDTLSKEVTAKESGWNVGISSISAKGSINVAVSRTNYVVLEDAVCVLTVSSRTSNFESKILVDFAGSQFSPNVRIDSTGLNDKEQLDAVIACNSPFDVDDDPSDDSASVIFEMKDESVLQSSSLLWGALVTIIVVGIYLFVIQRQDSALVRAASREQNTIKPKETIPPSTELDTVRSDTEEAGGEDITTFVEPEPEQALPSMVEQIPAVDDLTPSGRLDSIRREMNPDEDKEPESTIEDRMSKFFQ